MFLSGGNIESIPAPWMSSPFPGMKTARSLSLLCSGPKYSYRKPKFRFSLRRNLPLVLREKVEPVRYDMAFRDLPRRSRMWSRRRQENRPGQLSQRRSNRPVAQYPPRSLRSVKREGSRRTPEVKLVHPALANFAAEAQLMLASSVGNDVSQMAGDVVAPFRRRDTHLIESEMAMFGAPRMGLPFFVAPGLRYNPRALVLKRVVRVVEDLIEVTDAKKNLIREPRRNHGIQHQRNSFARESARLRSSSPGSSSPSPAPDSRRVVASGCLARRTSGMKVMLFVEIVIQFHYAVVAVARTRHGGEIIVQSRGQIRDRARPQRREQRRRQRALRGVAPYLPPLAAVSRLVTHAVEGSVDIAGKSEDVILLFKPDEENVLSLMIGPPTVNPQFSVPQSGAFGNSGLATKNGDVAA